jgi:three-Cys-motif partner protein
MSNDDHFQTYREHTQIKHAILKDYLSAWVPILGSWNQKICYIDGFCGPGLYEHEGETHDGSPIIALKIGEDFKDKAELEKNRVRSLNLTI